MEVLNNCIADMLHILCMLFICDLFLGLKKNPGNARRWGKWLLVILVSVLLSVIGEKNWSVILYILCVFFVLWLQYAESKKNLAIMSLWLICFLGILDEVAELLLKGLLEAIGLELQFSNSCLIVLLTVLIVGVAGFVFRKKNPEGLKKVGACYLLGFTVLAVIDSIAISLLEHYRTVAKMNPNVYAALFCTIIIAMLIQLAMALLLLSSRNTYREKMELTQMYLNAEKEHYEYLENRENETKRFRHDLRSHMHMLHVLYVQKEYEKMEAYLDELDERIEQLGNRITVNNGIVDAILNQYQAEAEKKKIELHVEGIFPSACAISAYDLCTIFSNLLSNALEAEEQCGGSRIDVTCRYMEKEIFVVIENDYDGKLFYENQQLKTRKTDSFRHGFGMGNVTECVEKNSGYIDVETENGRFKVMVGMTYEDSSR